MNKKQMTTQEVFDNWSTYLPSVDRPDFLKQLRALSAPAPASALSDRTTCPDCFRFAARNADDCTVGDCPKWYAIHDKEADADCVAFKNKTGYYTPLAAPEVARTQWIPISERLPDFDVRVLVARTSRKPEWVEVGEDYRGQRYGGSWGKTNGYQEVTHWMPLPTAPSSQHGPGRES